MLLACLFRVLFKQALLSKCNLLSPHQSGTNTGPTPGGGVTCGEHGACEEEDSTGKQERIYGSDRKRNRIY